MDKPDTAREKEVFMAALEIPTAQERARFLDEACRADASLRRRVDRLLQIEANTGKFLEPAAAAGDSVGYFGDYVLLGEIARGSSGVVFRARQSSLSRVVALKMLRDRPLLTTDPDIRRLRAEASSAASLDHPNIVPIYEVGTHEGQPYFSMKLIEGGTLQSQMAEHQADVRKAVVLMAKVARAVQHAHSKGILHRDLKPGNILIDTNGEPHIVDFGLARKMGLEPGLTATGDVIGTPHYMSPEQARGGSRELTQATDIYSLGAILYELLAGRRMFDSADLIELLRHVAESPAPQLPTTAPRALAAVAAQCLQKNPASRYASASALAEDLERWLRGEPVHAAGSARFWRLPSRLPWKSIVAGSAALLMAAGIKALWDAPRGVITVTTLVDELDPKGTTGSGVSLREALRDLADGGRIQFSAPGKIVLSDALGAIQIVKSVKIDGAAGATELEIHSGPAIDRTFFIAAKTRLELANVTLSGEAENARLRGSVGAIENNGTLVATGCGFISHGGGGSGGAITSSGSLALRRCVFRNNLTNMIGGAVQITGTGSGVEIEDCLFTGNRAAGIGGSAINITAPASAEPVRIIRCTISGNVWQPEAKRQRRTEQMPENSGGALRIHSGRVTVERCIIAGNEAPEAGTQDIQGAYESSGQNYIGGDPHDAPAILGSSLR